MKKKDFYRLTEILKKNAQYNILLGERANGKSGAVKEHAIREAWKLHSCTFALIRRFDEDIKQNLMETYFSDKFICEIIEEISEGQYNCITYYQRRFYFAHIDDNGKIEKGICCGVAFALNQDERYKSSTVYPDIHTIIFEEFTTKKIYLSEEVDRFMNLVSTIIRLNQALVFMIANKVSRVCPYFTEWSLRNVPNMKEGQIDTYDFETLQGDTVKIAVEMCASPEHKKSGMFFGRVGKAIEGGAWETKEHPHLKGDYSEYDVLYQLSLQHMSFLFNICLLMHPEGYTCVYVYPAKIKKHDRLLTEEYSTDANVTPNLSSKNRAEVMIAELVRQNKLVYPNNLCAEDFESVISNMKKNPFILI